MNKTNFKIELLQKMVAFLNETVVNEDETKDSKQEEQPAGEEEMKAPVATYTIEFGGDETILNVYDDNSIEPALSDGKYAFAEDESKLIVIEDGLFKGLEDKHIPEPTADHLDENLPVAQNEEEKEDDKKEDEQPEDKDAKIAELESSVAEKDAEISELESKIAELESALVGKDEEIETLKKQPTTQKAETKKVDDAKKGDFSKLVQALNTKLV